MTTYARRLGLFSGTMAVVGGIIGGGIFRTPATVAQRLVRRICPICSERDKPDPVLVRALAISDDLVAKGNFRRGKGCAKCAGPGAHPHHRRGGVRKPLLRKSSCSACR